MKLIVRICSVVMALGIMLLLGVKANASSGSEYVVTQNGTNYILSVFEDGGFKKIEESSDISDISDKLKERNAGVSSVMFSGVCLNEPMTLEGGEYTLCGTLSFEGGASLTILSESVTLSDLNLSFEGGGVLNHKNGVLNMTGGSIHSENSAVVLNHSASAVFKLSGGKIITDSPEPSVKSSIGTVIICGGEIENIKGVCVENSSSLYLSGSFKLESSEKNIITTRPITLSYNSEYIRSAASIKYLSGFNKGEIKCVFYECSENSLEYISLFDMNGEAVPVKFFSSDERVEEVNFGAVYLPYKISFYDKDNLLYTEEILHGEHISPQNPPLKTGYTSLGYSEIKDGKALFDFKSAVTSDKDFYAVYSLMQPNISLSSVSFVYDGLYHGFGLDELTHPLLDGASVNYVWYKNGAEVSSSKTLLLKNTADSGEYYAKVTLTYGSDSVSVLTPSVSVNIDKAVVNIPEIREEVYNGEYRTPTVYSNTLYTVSEVSALYVGDYPVCLSLNDKDNYRFEGTGETTVTIFFKIVPATNRWTQNIQISDIYEGSLVNPSAYSLYGDVKYYYSAKENGGFSETVPTLPGKYYVYAEVSENENYSGIRSETVSFLIIKEEVVGISVKNMPYKTEYKAFDIFSPEGLIFNVSHNSGRSLEVSYEHFSFEYLNGDSFRYGDGYINALYKGVSVSVPISVKKADYDMSRFIFSDTVVFYNGMKQSINYAGILPVGLDGSSPEYSIIGGGINAGQYSVIISFKTDSSNYNIPETKTAVLTVKPYVAKAVWERTSFVYDGDMKVPCCYYKDIFGGKVELDVLGGASFAGIYTALANTSDTNYILDMPTVKFEIKKADYDFSGVYWSDSGFVYDGTEKEVTLCGLPSGVSVVGYADNRGVNAGKYTAKATLFYDSNNYNPPPEIEKEWNIFKADYDLGGFSFSDNRAVYNFDYHYPILSGLLPTGADGITLAYAYQRGVKDVAEGRVLVEISFSTDSANYNLPDSLFAYVEVYPMPIEAVWQNVSLTYNGNLQSPNATSPYAEIKTLGQEKNAGSYTAYAVSLDPNFTVINNTVSFVINKAANRWQENVSATDIFEGYPLKVSGIAFAGKTEYRFYSDPECHNEAEPSSPGTYYMVAKSEGDDNYLPIESAPCHFSVIKIIPVQLLISLKNNSVTALYLITASDISAESKNNDGSFSEIPFSDIEIRYQRGEKLLFGDNFITVSYLGFTERVNINVIKADYDLSGIKWINTDFVYDGSEKRAELSGLPDGITITGYTGGVGTNAGIYPVSAEFTYDRENCNEPNIPASSLLIRKKVLCTPQIPSDIYSGKEITAKIPTSPLYTSSVAVGKNAGEYSVVFSLLDNENYTFSNGEYEVIGVYKIYPRKITVKVSDVNKYLFGGVETPYWTITEGSLAEGETLDLSLIFLGDKISATISGQNYDITVIPGEIKRVNRLSENGISVIFLIVLTLILVFLLCFIFKYRRKAFAGYTSRIKRRFRAKSKKSGGVTPLISAPKNLLTEPSGEGEEAVTNSFSEQKIVESMLQKLSVDRFRADNLISDNLAKELMKKEDNTVYTSGSKKGIINVDTLSDNFSAGERVDVNILKDHMLVPYDTAYIKVLARGIIDKPLRVYANEFSLSAVKMIALTGGEAIKVVTVRKNEKKKS